MIFLDKRMISLVYEGIKDIALSWLDPIRFDGTLVRYHIGGSEISGASFLLKDQPLVVPPSRWGFAVFLKALSGNFTGHLPPSFPCILLHNRPVTPLPLHIRTAEIIIAYYYINS